MCHGRYLRGRAIIVYQKARQALKTAELDAKFKSLNLDVRPRNMGRALQEIGAGGYRVAELCHVREGWHEVDALVNFAAQGDKVVVDADDANGYEFFSGENLARRNLPR